MGGDAGEGLLRAWGAFLRTRWGWFTHWFLHPAEYTDRSGTRRENFWWWRDLVGDLLLRALVALLPLFVILGIAKALTG